MPFAQDALETFQPSPDPLQVESNAMQDQQFAEMEAALVDQQQGDVRLQEQLPLPTPKQPKRRLPLQAPIRGPMILMPTDSNV